MSADSIVNTEPKVLIQDVNFFYGASQALWNINLAIPTQQVTALIGPSGCGKSTLLRCLNRLNDLIDGARLEGTILLDGLNIHDPNLDITDLRKRVGMVFQRSNPFPKSIYENAVYGPRLQGIRKHAELDVIAEKSLTEAGLWNEVKDRLTKSALGLSGGQQQRVAIARAFLKDAPVLILDEATSHLDAISEHIVHKSLNKLKKNRTTIIIAHRLSTIRDADKIIVLNNGSIEQTGSHSNLLKQTGLYKQLVSKQLGITT